MKKKKGDLSKKSSRTEQKQKSDQEAVDRERNEHTRYYRFRRSEKRITQVSNDTSTADDRKRPDFLISSDGLAEGGEPGDNALTGQYYPVEKEAHSLGQKEEIDDARLAETLRTLRRSATHGDEPADRKLDYAAPDSELFDKLSEGGRVCDLPGEDASLDMQTKEAPCRKVEGLLSPEELIRAINRGGSKDDASIGGDTRSVPAAKSGEVPDISGRQFQPDRDSDDRENASDRFSDADAVMFSATDDADDEDLEDMLFPSVESAEQADSGADSHHEDAEAGVKPKPGDDDVKIFSGKNSRSDIPGESAEKEKNEPDENEANLMVAFGMEEELDEIFGKEKADKIRAGFDGKNPEKKKKKLVIPPNETVEKEFISPAEAGEIKEKYKREFGKNLLRLIGVIVIALILMMYENAGILGAEIADFINPSYYPIVHAMVGFQFLLFDAVILLPCLKRGIRGLWHRKPVADSILPITLVISFAYCIFACYIPAGGAAHPFYFPASLLFVLSAFAERFNLHREFMAFCVVSSHRKKMALMRLDDDSVESETQAFDQFLPSRRDIFQINRTNFVDGFFRRTNAYSSMQYFYAVLLPVVLLLPIGTVLSCLALHKGVIDSIQIGYTAFSFGMPAAAMMTFCLPAFKAQQLSFKEKSCIIGDTVSEEYGSASAISFDDREAFPASGVKLRSVNVFGSGRIDQIIDDCSAIYRPIGGPFSDVLNAATADMKYRNDAEILSIENDGVEALLGERHFFLGKADYLRRHGYLPVSDPEDDALEHDEEISVSFMVCNGELIAKLYVQYCLDADFDQYLKKLYRSGVCIGIKTLDPNINDDMLSARIKLDKYPVRVMKYESIDVAKKGRERTDSGIVSIQSAKSLLETFTRCDRLKQVAKTNMTLNAIALLAGVAITALVALLGSVGAVDSLYVALYQLFWLIPVSLLSRFILL